MGSKTDLTLEIRTCPHMNTSYSLYGTSSFSIHSIKNIEKSRPPNPLAGIYTNAGGGKMKKSSRIIMGAVAAGFALGASNMIQAEQCWISSSRDGLAVLNSDGALVLQDEVNSYPRRLDVNPVDGSCWVLQYFGPYDDGWLSKWDAEGTKVGEDDRVLGPWTLAVNLTDGKCWVGINGEEAGIYRFNSDVQAEAAFYVPGSGAEVVEDIEIDPNDGSLYFTAGGQIIKKDAVTKEYIIPFIPQRGQIEIDPADGSCWVLSSLTTTKLDANGNQLFTLENVGGTDLKVDPADGSCWIAQSYTRGITKLSKDGTVLFSVEGLGSLLAVSPENGSCWTLDAATTVVKLAADGSELFRVPCPVSNPLSMGVGPGSIGETATKAIDHAFSDTRLWADNGVADLKANTRNGERVQWIIEELESGYVYLTNSKTGEKLRAANNGSDVLMDTIVTGKAQWEIIDTDNGEFMLKNKRYGTLLSGNGGDYLALRDVTDPGPNYRWLLTTP